MVAAFSATVGVANASWGTGNQHQTVPVYVYPSWWDANNGWRTVIENSNATDIGSTFIANLGVNAQGVNGGGPGTAVNTDYSTIIGYAHDYGHNVVGYVDTAYGARPLADVKADIDAWYSRYSQTVSGTSDLTAPGSVKPDNGVAPDSRIDGIFFDQVSYGPNDAAPAGSDATATAAGYYRDLFLYVKNGGHGDFDNVRVNPGVTPASDWMLKNTGTVTQIADEVMVFEGPEFAPPGSNHGFNKWSKKSWMNNYPASDFDVMVYSAPQANIPTICTKLKNNRAGNVYITSEGLNPTPWNAIVSASYYADIRTHCG